MATSNTTIELNGKLYDARTGQIIEPGSPPTTPAHTETTASHTEAATPHKQQAQNKGQYMDGFVRKTKTPQHVSHHAHVAEDLQAATPPETTDQNVKTPKSPREINKALRKLEKSKTLMRPSVKKPSSIKSDVEPLKQVRKPAYVTSLRHSRSENINKSPLISRFGEIASRTVAKTEEQLSVVPTPAKISKQAAEELQKFEQSIKNATTHLYDFEQDVVKKVHFLEKFGFKNKFGNITAMSLAALLLVGFFGYQNSTQISMRLAAERSGVAATMPGYKPAGYGASKNVDVQDGKVAVSFKSRTDQTKSFNLTQEASSWNSTTLLANHVTKQTCATCYQTWNSGGKTIYIYNGSNASWVNGGVLYNIDGNAELTSDQLLRIANSM